MDREIDCRGRVYDRARALLDEAALTVDDVAAAAVLRWVDMARQEI